MASSFQNMLLPHFVPFNEMCIRSVQTSEIVEKLDVTLQCSCVTMIRSEIVFEQVIRAMICVQQRYYYFKNVRIEKVMI